jgi:hypothetical protein
MRMQFIIFLVLLLSTWEALAQSDRFHGTRNRTGEKRRDHEKRRIPDHKNEPLSKNFH